MERLWTTADRPAHEQYPYWREVICQAYTVVDPVPCSRDRFDSTVRAKEIGGLIVSRTISRAQTVNRSSREIRQKMAEAYFLILQVSGTLLAEQGGRSALVRPGHLVLVDAAEPYRLQWDDWTVLCIEIPHARMRQRLTSLGEITARCLATDEGIGWLLRNQTQALREMPESCGASVQDLASGYLVDLLVMELQGAATRETGPNAIAIRAGLKVAIDRHIERYAADSTLSVSGVAEHFHVSIRTLHRMFESTGNSFTQVVLEQRLQKAAALIADRSRILAISDVAYRSGFNDLSYFCKAFRRRFEMSASEWREHRLSVEPA